MDIISHLSPLSPGLIDELEAYMAPGGEGCYAAQADTRRTGGHQLPESPPDSGSENPYSPSESHVPHTITVSQNVLGSDYMLVHDHLPTHEILHQNGNYIYEELKPDNMDHEVLRNNLSDVVVLPQDPSIMDLGTVRHELGLSESIAYQNRYNHMRVEMSDLDQGIINPQLVAIGHDSLPVYTNLQEPSTKKRKHSQDVNSQVKCEPAALSPESASQHLLHRPAPPSVDGSEAGDDVPLQCIRFSTFHHTPWHSLYDSNLKQLATPSYIVGADKGFNYSQIDEAFVCQKKNHFQVTCQTQVQGDPQYVKTAEGFKKINNFRIHFYGVKAEDPSQEVRVEQSQSDRTKKPFHPVPVELRREGSKVTVCRLHFAETTNNNMRKKGRPNPDQRHFQLVVALRAHTQSGEFMIAAQASDRIIVRASNPGQFESDCSESWWQRGLSENSVHFNGKVGINTDRPDESCVINGNLKLMGHIVQPSDARAKHNIQELDTSQQLRNVQNIRVVKFDYDPSFAQHSGLLGFDPSCPAPQSDTGVIAQEVRRVLPEAVKEAGDVTLPNGDTIPKFLVVNKDRIFMENLGAVKELCKVTGNLESRIDQLERINKKLCKISVQRRDSARSNVSNDSHFSGLSSKSHYSECNVDHIRDIARNIRRHECCHKLSHNSPKYTRKQCKNCHGSFTKYGKYYNYNKTCVKYHSEKEKSEDKQNFPAYIESIESSPIQKLPGESYSTLSKKKDTCLWLRDDEDFKCGNTRISLCCKRKNRFSGDETELISNKFLQIVITILIFIMAVCLVVMSALYFREHQELLSMKDTRQDKFQNYAYYGKPNLNNPAPTHRATSDSNQIIKIKSHAQHGTKTVKEKVSLKTTQEYITTPLSEPVHATTTAVPSKHYNSWKEPEQSPHLSEPERLEVKHSGDIVTLLGGCTFSINTDNNLDAECQSSCLDPPQTFENQEPIERTNSEKDINDTFARPKHSQKDNHLIIPVMPESNKTENLKTENDSLVKQIHDESIAANDIDTNKQNGTEGGNGRLKRGARGRSKVKRETNEALLDSSSREWANSDQEEEDITCYKISIGMWSSSIANMTILEEKICDTDIHNYSYKVPLPQCMQHKYVYFTFRTSSANKLRLCDVQCKLDSINCQTNRNNAKPARTENIWTSKVSLDCNMDTVVKIRAGQRKDLCSLTEENNIPFTEYNFHLIQACHNQ